MQYNKNILTFTVTHSEKNLERFLLEDIELVPRHALKRAFIQKKVFVNAKPAHRMHNLKRGDVVEVRSQDFFLKKDLTLIPNPKLSLMILQETPEIIVVNKPAGQSVHPLQPHEVDTTLNALAAQFPETGSIFNKTKPLEGGLVHRLDRGTSGILVCARTLDAWKKLKHLWEMGTVKKFYLAWVSGLFDKEGKCHLFLSHDPKSKKRMRVSLQKPSHIASWETKTSFLPIKTAHDQTLLLIQLHTGVMHQIRAITAALGHPILGDNIYTNRRILQNICFVKLDDDTQRIFKKLRDRIQFITKPQISHLPHNGFFLHALWLSLDNHSEFFVPPPEYF